MFEKHPWKSDILSKDAGRIPGFYISGTLGENGLSESEYTAKKSKSFIERVKTRNFIKL